MPRELGATGLDSSKDGCIAGKHPLQQRPVGCFSSPLIHNFQILGSALCQLREVPSQLTGAPQSNDWREVAGAQGLGCRGRNGARSKVPGGAAVRCAVRGVPHPRQNRLDCVWGGIRVGLDARLSLSYTSSNWFQ